MVILPLIVEVAAQVVEEMRGLSADQLPVGDTDLEVACFILILRVGTRIGE